jgi:hypothetical protein
MKSVPNLISYLHEFYWNFSQFIAIYFELLSSGVNFYFKKSLTRGTHLSASLSPCRARSSACNLRVAATRTRPCRAIKALPTAWSEPPHPDSAVRRRCRAADAALATPHARPSRPRHLRCPKPSTPLLGPSHRPVQVSAPPLSSGKCDAAAPLQTPRSSILELRCPHVMLLRVQTTRARHTVAAVELASAA